MKFTGFAIAVTALLAVAQPPCAQAQMTPKDLQVAARSLAFFTGRNIAALRVAVIYDPQNGISHEEADRLALALGRSYNAGRVTLVPVQPPLLSTQNLPQLDNNDVAFVTAGLKQWHAGIADAARQRHVLTVTSDLDCVVAGYCVMGVLAEPRVQVLINHELALQSNIEFAAGFRLLVTEL